MYSMKKLQLILHNEPFHDILGMQDEVHNEHRMFTQSNVCVCVDNKL
jgi:hypothetical protein